MRLRACIALLLLVSACATPAPSPREPAAGDPRLANLQRAAELPWKDGGRCVVREASQPWPALVERCFQALDQDRLEFHDPTGRCAVASAGAAAMGIGLCVLAAPELVVGRVAVRVGLVNPSAKPWTVAGAALMGPKGEELKPLPLWHTGPIHPGTEKGRVVVEFEAAREQAEARTPSSCGTQRGARSQSTK